MQRSEQRETRQLYLRLEGRYTRARCPPSQRWCRDEHMHAPIGSKPKDGVREATNCRDGRTDARTAETDGKLLDAKRRHRGNDGTSCGRELPAMTRGAKTCTVDRISATRQYIEPSSIGATRTEGAGRAFSFVWRSATRRADL